MLTNRLRLYIRTVSTRGGFTLVELLVVIGIIAILAGVALGPITNGIKKAKESSGVQSAHALGLAMYSAANDNNQLYPDATGGNASNIAKTLLGGGYVTDPNIFYISGDATAAKYSSTAAAAGNIAQSNVSWDFLSASGAGVSSTNFQFMPLMWSTLSGTGCIEPSFTPSGTGPISATITSNSPFGADGSACFFINNASSFLNSAYSSGYTVTFVSSSGDTGQPAGTLTVLKGL